MKILLFICIISIYPALLRGQDQVSFYVHGHADDWQLFMSKNIVDDLSFAKVVIITLTAGDAGHGCLAYENGKIPYYIAREKGAVYSSKFACDILGKEVSDVPFSSIVSVNGHFITKYVYKNHIINYFLRLPDGLYGEGLPSTGNQSLEKLRKGSLKTITAVDHSTIYHGWNDLTQTLKSIIIAESGLDEQVWVNTHSSDRKYNEGDHSDHYSTSEAVQDAVKDLPWAGIVSWMGYRSRKLPANLSTSEIVNATAIFSAYSWSILESGYVSSFDNAHRRFLPNDFFLITKKPVAGSFSVRAINMIKLLKRKLMT